MTRQPIPPHVNDRALSLRNDAYRVSVALTGSTTKESLSSAESALNRILDNARQLKADVRTMKRAARDEEAQRAVDRRIVERDAVGVSL